MQRVFTERAHLMCPNMYFGIVIMIDAIFDKERILKTGNALSEAHPFLKSLLGNDEAGYYYDISDENQIRYVFKDTDAIGIDDKTIIDEYNKLTMNEWNLRTDGMLKILCFKNGTKTVLLFVFHHLLADGRGAFLLAEEFAACYKKGVMPGYVEEKLISSREDMPNDSTLPFISKLLIKRANRQWKNENHVLAYDEYLKLADQFLDTDKVSRTVRIESAEVYNDIVEACHERHVSVNDYLMAQMYINDQTEKIVIAYDLREKLNCYKNMALGNYSTAFSVAYKSKSKDVWKAAEDVHDLVKKKTNHPKELFLVLQCYAELDGGILDAAFVASRCGYESNAAKFIGSMFFGFEESKGYSITNLGRFESDSIEEAAFLPPASPAMRKTLGVLTVNGRMAVSSANRK